MKMPLQLHILHQSLCHISLFGHHFHFYSESLQNRFKAWLYSLSPHAPPPLLPLGLTLITLLSSFQTKLISSTDSPLPNAIVNSYLLNFSESLKPLIIFSFLKISPLAIFGLRVRVPNTATFSGIAG